MSTNGKHRIAGILAVAIVTGVSLHATAGEETRVTAAASNTTQSLAVSYADLNLDSPAGQAVLHQRISNAARQICGSENYRVAGGLRAAQLNAQCYEETLADTLSKLPQARVASR
jgi:UrcA family protein